MEEYFAANREHWDEITPIHARSELYDLAGFKAGKTSLSPAPLELKEMGSVAQKEILHLQCHFGMDTLSLARLGAKVTGVDFSPRAIELARSLSQEIGVPANFILCNIYDLKDHLAKQFDVVYTSSGVLYWLPDLTRWAAIIAHFLKSGGFFYIWESHPILNIFDNSRQASKFKVEYSYFHSPEPAQWEPEGDYAEPEAQVTKPEYGWTHSLSDVLNALLGAGLRLEFVHEFPFCSYRWSPFTTREADGYWHVKGDSIPLTFSLKAVKPD